MNKYIRFNFYSRIMLQTITVIGSDVDTWHGGSKNFKVKTIINNSRQEIIATEVHNEATEYYNCNKENISLEIIDL